MSQSTGALSPQEATKETLETGLHHLAESTALTFVKNVYGALLLSMGGLMSLVLGTGFKAAAEGNPALSRLLQGAAFPVGLALVYTVGAELFTGHPMYLTLTSLSRFGKPSSYPLVLLVSWLGNLTGALFAAYTFSTLTGTLQDEPFRSGIILQVHEDIIALPWHTIFIRAIGCGWLVTLAMFLGTQNKDGISKFLALHLPFMISCVAKFPHTVEYMYLAGAGMMVGSELSVGAYFWKCLLPITLGNCVGGGILTGGYLWVVNLGMAEGGSKDDGEGEDGDGEARYRD